MDVHPRIVLIPGNCTEEDLTLAIRGEKPRGNVAAGDIGIQGKIAVKTLSPPLADKMFAQCENDDGWEYLGKCRCNCGAERFAIPAASVHEVFHVLGPVLGLEH